MRYLFLALRILPVINFLDIPAPQGNAYYKKPFVVDIQFLPAKTFVLDNCTFETVKHSAAGSLCCIG
jgi:hypothetical protein